MRLASEQMPFSAHPALLAVADHFSLWYSYQSKITAFSRRKLIEISASLLSERYRKHRAESSADQGLTG
jgi:hypothetical protein